MANKILYVVLNGELKMSAGKAAAQAVHAVTCLEGAVGTHQFTDEPRRTVIILEAKNGEQLNNLYEYLKGTDLYAKRYIDEGVNEVSPFSVTALAVAPFDDDDEEKREVFRGLPLFPKKKKGWFK